MVATSNPGSRGVFGDLLPEVLVPSGTAQGLADAITMMLQDSNLQQKVREQYPVISERYSTRDMVRKTAAVYEAALRAREQREAAAWRVPQLLPKLQFSAFGALLRRTFSGQVTDGDELLTAGRGGQ